MVPQISSLHTCLQITRHGIVGKGSFGVTYDGEFKGTKVAIKSVEVRDEIEGKSFLRELDTLTRARHPNIMAFYGEQLTSSLFLATESLSAIDMLKCH